MAAIVEQHLSVAKTIISFDLHTGAGAWGHPMLLSIAEQRYTAHDWGKAIYGEWLTLLFTGAGRDSVTVVTATATGYLSHYLLTSLADTRICLWWWNAGLTMVRICISGCVKITGCTSMAILPVRAAR